MAIKISGGVKIPQGKFSVTSNNPPTWTTAAGTIGTEDEGTVVSFQFEASDPEQGTSGLTFSKNSGDFPAGLSMNSSGLLTGTASDVGSDTQSDFNLRVTDAGGLFADEDFSMTITDIPPGFVSWDNSVKGSTSVISGMSGIRAAVIDSDRVFAMTQKSSGTVPGRMSIVEIDSGVGISDGGDKNSGAASSSKNHNIVVLNSTTGIWAWLDGNTMKGRVITIGSGTTYTLDSITTIGASSGGQVFEMAPIDSTRALLFDLISGNQAEAYILTISGSNISRSAALSFPETEISRIHALERIDSTRFLAIWTGSTDSQVRRAAIITITGATTATFGSIVDIATGVGTTFAAYNATILDSSTGVVCYRQASTDDSVVTELSFSGSTITVGTTATVNDVEDGVGQVTAINSTEFFLTAGRLPSGSQGLTGQYGKLDSGVFTFGTAIQMTGVFSLETDANPTPLSTMLFDPFRIVAFYRNGSNTVSSAIVTQAPS